MKDLAELKTASLHPMPRRSAALACTKRWWSRWEHRPVAIDCIHGQDSPVSDLPLATVFQWADLAPDPSRLR